MKWNKLEGECILATNDLPSILCPEPEAFHYPEWIEFLTENYHPKYFVLELENPVQEGEIFNVEFSNALREKLKVLQVINKEATVALLTTEI